MNLSGADLTYTCEINEDIGFPQIPLSELKKGSVTINVKQADGDDYEILVKMKD